MNFIDEVYAKRKKLADVLADEDYSGIREIVEELYPDKAHFIYELLQNAEDVGATEASFTLNEQSLSFEHNGRPFDKDDVWGITNIGKGTKKTNEDKIGRFGVGFKAVFAYSETPHIWSPTFSFKIANLVLPLEIETKLVSEGRTRFEFPFNSPKKSTQDAYEEVKTGLEELAETTLLFLSHLNSIRWQIGEQGEGEVLRIKHTENHFEVLKQVDGKTTASSHFLCFSKTVEGLEKHQRLAVAFDLSYLPKVTAYDHKKALSDQLKIVSAIPGRVAVFFPAEKETSGLRFHLHAPFVPELSRASIKETPANEPLYRQLSRLAAEALHKIRDLDLLNGEFLGVLPNPQDAIPPRYQSIRTAIIDEMKNMALTPTHSKSHAPAKYLLQAKASLKDLLAEEDLNVLYDWYGEPPQWAIGASQKNSDQDRFLTGLEITRWDINEFVKRIINSCSFNTHTDFMKWLAAKPLEWHQRLYSLLYKEVVAHDGPDSLKTLSIVRLDTGDYSRASECYFPSDGGEFEDILPRVAREVYSSGKNPTNQEDAKNFLDQIGVSEIGEVEQVKALLQERYSISSWCSPNLKDIIRFISLVEKEPLQAGIFTDYCIFKKADETWGKPSQVYLDLPYLETGLSVYYSALGENARRSALSKDYEESGIPLEKLREFAKTVSVQTSVGEAEKIENILKQRYMDNNSFNPDINDITQFISLVQKEPVQARIFNGYRIFKKIDGGWDKASKVYLDKPYLDTGLRAYYNRFGKNSSRSALSEDYEKSKIPMDKLMKFAKAVDVQTYVGEAEQVETILDKFYTDKAFNPDIMDIERFIALVEKEPRHAKKFVDHFIFLSAEEEWGQPCHIYLDYPYLETGLSAYYKALGENAPRSAMSKEYEKLEIPLDKLRKFAENVGVLTHLEVMKIDCYKNPKWPYLRSVSGERSTSPRNEDYIISGLNLSKTTIELSKLVWRTMCSLAARPYIAIYQKNETNGAHYADSQLVHQLKTSAWVPQRDGTFVLPSEALRDELPQGFPFDEGDEWLKKIDFGKNAHKKSEEQSKKQEIAKELGFVDEQSLSAGKWFAGLDPEERQKIQDDVERKQQVELPDNSPRNPGRRAELVSQQAADAPERTTEKRIRSVSIGREDVKQEAAQYLIEQYTNPSGIMFCQICKAELPFRLNNGSYYFEKVDFLPGLQKRHYQNYLALCPNHSAMFQHTNGLADLMRGMFAKIEENEPLEVVLAQQNMTVYFTETHRLDLQAVVQAELKEEG